MFTPPPSPLPVPRIIVTSDESPEGGDEKDLVVQSPSLKTYHDDDDVVDDWDSAVATHAESHVRKQTVARRIRWTILLVPAVLVFVALTTRHIASDHGGMADHVDENWSSATHDRSHIHKRVPQVLTLSDPAAPTASSILATSAASSVGTQTQTSSQASSTTTVPQTQQTIPPVPSNPVLPTPFPQPFDTSGASANVTYQSCAVALQNMTDSDAFRSCRPFSLLEQFSDTFIEAQTNLSSLNTLIWGTCSTTLSFDQCTANLDWFANQLASSCSNEVANDNEMVTATILALRAYPVLRSAGCLVDQQANAYCYEEAVHNQSPYDLFLYSLPLGIGMPSTATPSCSSCSGSLFGLYADAIQAGNDSASGLKSTYDSAASAAVSACGNGFAVVNVATSSADRRWRISGSGSSMAVASVLLLGALLLR